MQASPVPDPSQKGKRVLLKGEIPSPMNPPSGCRFRTRCPLATDLCAAEAPPIHHNGDHRVECHYPGKSLTQHQAEQEAGLEPAQAKDHHTGTHQEATA